VQGFRIDLAWADADWANQALKTLAEVSEALGKTPAVILDTSGPEIRVYNTAKACLSKENAVAQGVAFEAGSDVSLCRGGGVSISSAEVHLDCSRTFTELAIEVGAVLHISSYLAAGVPSPPLCRQRYPLRECTHVVPSQVFLAEKCNALFLDISRSDENVKIYEYWNCMFELGCRYKLSSSEHS
jgi:hypothetical protein